jgi:guanylate kinase
MVIVVSGPSGVGKDTILDEVFARDPLVRKCVTVTTRQPRSGEIEGKHYYFVTRTTFEERIPQGYFLEWARVHNDLYGTPLWEVRELNEAGFDVILKIDVQGFAAVRAILPDVVSIFLSPPSLDELAVRLIARGTEDAASIEKRRHDAVNEIACMRSFQYVVVNRVVEDAVRDVLIVLRSERLKTSRAVVDGALPTSGPVMPCSGSV